MPVQIDPQPSVTASATPSPQAVPLLDLARQHQPLREEVAAALMQVYDSGQFVLGPQVTSLEKNIASYCQTKHAVGCASGSDALLLALMALEIGPGDEVIVPSFTFFATVSAITRLGARPIFADIDPDTFNIDPMSVGRLINKQTRAIIPVHLFGQCADMEALTSIAAYHGAALVEDVAQAIGAEFNGRRAGSMGAMGCLSFYPTKNLGGAGDGGMVITQSDELGDRLQLLRGHGMRPRDYHQIVGINSRLDSFQAAVLNVKFPHLDGWCQLRQANAARYSELFRGAKLAHILGLPVTNPRCRHVWNQYVIRVPDGRRDALRQFLAEAKIGSEIYYPLGIHQQKCYEHLGVDPDALPETQRAALEVLALPIFPELTADEQKITVDRIAAFFAAVGGHKLAPPKFLNVPSHVRHA